MNLGKKGEWILPFLLLPLGGSIPTHGATVSRRNEGLLILIRNSTELLIVKQHVWYKKIHACFKNLRSSKILEYYTEATQQFKQEHSNIFPQDSKRRRKHRKKVTGEKSMTEMQTPMGCLSWLSWVVLPFPTFSRHEASGCFNL